MPSVQTLASWLASAIAPADFQRYAFVVQRDHRGRASATEWDAHASQADIARALCDNDLPDCPVIRIIECDLSEGWSRDVTEDIARLIAGVRDEAARDGWDVRACAHDLMARFDLDAPQDDTDGEAELMQQGFDGERDRRAMRDVREQEAR